MLNVSWMWIWRHVMVIMWPWSWMVQGDHDAEGGHLHTKVVRMLIIYTPAVPHWLACRPKNLKCMPVQKSLLYNDTWLTVGVIRESWAMFYILYHSAEMKGKGRIPKLNVVSKTLEGLLALYNVTVGPIAAVYPQEGYGKIAQLSLHWGELSHRCRRVVPP